MKDTKSKILTSAIHLFSAHGFRSVSMRQISNDVKISAPALYNHFKDKKTLYIAAIEESFKNKSDLLLEALTGQSKPLDSLEHFVRRLSEIQHDDPEFRHLIQRELLDGDDDRLRYLAEELFGSAFQRLMDILTELKPDGDSHGLAVMIVGMVQKPFELNPLDSFFPDSQQQHCQPDYITRQVMAILSAYFGATA